MKCLVQRVKKANVTVEEKIIGEINQGFLIFLGVSDDDNEDIADKIVQKLIKLRIFDDENGKTNLDILTVNGELLIISQFTLYADITHGNRPSFIKAGAPEHANRLYEYFIDKCKEYVGVVQKGSFGANMQVSLINDGPFTVMLDSDEILRKK